MTPERTRDKNNSAHPDITCTKAHFWYTSRRVTARSWYRLYGKRRSFAFRRRNQGENQVATRYKRHCTGAEKGFDFAPEAAASAAAQCSMHSSVTHSALANALVFCSLHQKAQRIAQRCTCDGGRGYAREELL
eukprot:838967-Rhodomonas_salina.2